VVPNTGPFRIIRVETTMTEAEAQQYLVPKTGAGARRRSYYLDTAKMSAADLAYWNTNRAIQTTEATFKTWLSRK
jgi:hypothetical protein